MYERVAAQMPDNFILMKQAFPFFITRWRSMMWLTFAGILLLQIAWMHGVYFSYRANDLKSQNQLLQVSIEAWFDKHGIKGVKPNHPLARHNVELHMLYKAQAHNKTLHASLQQFAQALLPAVLLQNTLIKALQYVVLPVLYALMGWYFYLLQYSQPALKWRHQRFPSAHILLLLAALGMGFGIGIASKSLFSSVWMLQNVGYVHPLAQGTVTFIAALFCGFSVRGLLMRMRTAVMNVLNAWRFAFQKTEQITEEYRQ
jgi:hypothetical protein